LDVSIVFSHQSILQINKQFSILGFKYIVYTINPTQNIMSLIHTIGHLDIQHNIDDCITISAHNILYLKLYKYL